MTEQQHRVSVRKADDPDFLALHPDGHVAECSCGEFTELRSTKERAILSKLAHRADVAATDEDDDSGEETPKTAAAAGHKTHMSQAPATAPSASPTPKPAEKEKK